MEPKWAERGKKPTRVGVGEGKQGGGEFEARGRAMVAEAEILGLGERRAELALDGRLDRRGRRADELTELDFYGASGAAVQNMNIMLGLDETTCLE